MLFTLNDFLFGICLPAVVSFLVLVIVHLAAAVSRRLLSIAAATACAAGTLTGYYTLELGPFVPQIDREWIPLAPLLAVPFAATASASGWRRLAGFTYAAIALSGLAVVLVPDWESLEQTRLTYQVVWVVLTLLVTGVCVWALSEKQDPESAAYPVDSSANPSATASPATASPDMQSGRPSGMVASIVQVCCLVQPAAHAFPLLALSGSLRFATVAFCIVGGCLGVLLANLVANSFGERNLSKMGATVLGISGVWMWGLYATLLTGLLNSWSEIPYFVYAVLPLAGVLGILTERRLRQWPTYLRIVIPIAVSLVASSAVLGVAIAAEWESITQPGMY